MCGTCGCSDPEGTITIRRPGEAADNTDPVHSHHHDQSQNHDHTHHNHEHPHRHDPETGRVIQLEQDILAQNNLLAERNRGFFEAKNITTINFLSSPGSGKTSLLEKTAEALKGDLNFYVIEGDQQTMNDAERIEKTGVPVVQVNTGSGCHLEANMVNQALKKLKPEPDSILLIENVGNLVCPAMFDLGEAQRVVIISVTEGDDKPIKYPTIFQKADVCIINKIDLLPYVQFDVEKSKEYARRINSNLKFFETSATTGEGMQAWFEWLKKQG